MFINSSAKLHFFFKMAKESFQGLKIRNVKTNVKLS